MDEASQQHQRAPDGAPDGGLAVSVRGSASLLLLLLLLLLLQLAAITP
jgi:hypothetical protein